MEYVTVNKNMDLWLIDYDENIADLVTSITINDLETNETEYKELNDSIDQYIESQGYTINDDWSSETSKFFERLD
jgi:hypothetical protein